MGQQTDDGRYPIHFHMCFDKKETAAQPYVKGCSIHDTFARCVTIHGSHGIKVRYSTYTVLTSWFHLFRQVAIHTITIDQTYNNTKVRYC